MSQPMPPSAVDWNNLFNLAAFIALAAVAIVMGTMIYLAIRYRQRKRVKFIPEINLGKSRARDAIIFASISIIILVSLTAASYRLTPNARLMPSSNYLPIDVTAFQWGFRFDYPGNVTELGQVNVPANTTVMFNVTSSDVMHNFYLAQYKVSIDAIPGMYNVIYVTTPAVAGNSTITYDIRCKELCGAGHTFMAASMIVMSQTAFNQWVSNQTASSQGAGG
jgi:cytochrome c oxidase subunit 2